LTELLNCDDIISRVNINSHLIHTYIFVIFKNLNILPICINVKRSCYSNPKTDYSVDIDKTHHTSGSVHITHLSSSDLISSKLSALIRCCYGKIGSVHSARRSSLWRVTAHSVQMKSGQMR